MTELVQAQSGSGGTSDTFSVDITSADGHTLVAQITAWVTGDTPISLASVTDSTGGGNAWQYSTAQQSQNPPAAGSYSATNGQYGFTAEACCIGALPVTSVTFTFSAEITFGEAGVNEFSGLPAGSVLLTAASDGTLQADATSYTTPALTAPSTALAVVSTSNDNGEFTGVTPAGWEISNYGDAIGGYVLAAPAGTIQPTFTQSPGADVPSSAILAIGAPPPAAQDASDLPLLLAGRL